jgi:hypothetical protein
MIDDDDRVARIDQGVQLTQQPFDIGRMQACRGLIQGIERPAPLSPLQLGRQLDPLGFAARQLGRRWPSRR